MGMTLSLIAVEPSSREQLGRDLSSGRGLTALKDRPRCTLEKSWGAIHFVLTGTAYEGEFPAAFLLQGGDDLIEPVDQTDTPPRWLSADLVNDVNELLTNITTEDFIGKCDCSSMVAADVYSVSEDNFKDMVEELQIRFAELKRVVGDAAAKKLSLVVSG